MNPKAVFFPGGLAPDVINKITQDAAIDISFIMSPNQFFKIWNKTNLLVYNIESLKNSEAFLSYNNTEIYQYYLKAIDIIFSDSRAYYLMERVFSFKKENSIFNNASVITVFINNSLKVLFEKKPTHIILFSTPHSLSWFFCICAEILGIKVIYTQTSPLPWKKWIVEGVKNPKTTQLEGEDKNSEKLAAWITKLQSTYNSAIPEYERRRNSTYKYGDNSFISNFRDIIKSKNLNVAINKLIVLPKKMRTLQFYQKATARFKLPKNYIVLFLHFQPERTSLPEGRSFAQQTQIVLDLFFNTPSHTTILVKEHPSMFRNKFNERVRNLSFYKNIANMENVSLVPLSFNTFDLIDNSRGVITITGTVGMEAILRGKPVLAYGDAQYLNFPLVHDQKNQEQKDQFFTSVNEGESQDKRSEPAILTQLTHVDDHSFPIDELGISTNAIINYFNRINA